MVSKVIPIMGPGCGKRELEKCPPSSHFELTEKEMMEALKNPNMCSKILGLKSGTITSIHVSAPPKTSKKVRPNATYCCIRCLEHSVCCMEWPD
jgi:hypothetical protein